MALDEVKDDAAAEQRAEELIEQPVRTSSTVPIPDPDSEDLEEDEEKEKNSDQGKEVEAEEGEVETGKGNGNEGDPKNPSSSGTSTHTAHTTAEQNAVHDHVRKTAEKSAKKASYNPTGAFVSYRWGNITYRNDRSTSTVRVRVGHQDFIVHNPTKKILDTPQGYPVLIDTVRGKLGVGGMGVQNNAVVLLDHNKMDLQNIEAQRAAAGVYENIDASMVFDKNFSHIYYSSRARNWQIGKVVFDSVSQQLSILCMEHTHKGKWAKGGLIPIRMDAITLGADLKLGTEVSFTTAIWGKSVTAQQITPCALMTEAETEVNSRAALPVNPHELTVMLDSAVSKTMGTQRMKLLYREMGRELENRVGDEKWLGLDDKVKNPVDILLTDNSEGPYPETTVVLKLTTVLINFLCAPTPKAPNPLCWDFLKSFLSPEEMDMLDKKVLDTGIGLTVFVETTESYQKLFLEWANSSITSAVSNRNIDSKHAFIDSIGVTCSFGPLVTAANFNEMVSDKFFDPDKTVGLQSIKIFDSKIPVLVTFCPKNSAKVAVETDLTTRGLVVLSLEAVSKKILEEDRLSIVVTEEATKASSFFSNNRELQIKFRTTEENCKLFKMLEEMFSFNIYFDLNPASSYAGRKPSRGFRTVKCSTMGWSEDQYLSLLDKVNAHRNNDFFVMRLGDMVGGADEEWTRFTIGTEDFRTGKVLAALKLKLPLLQMMGINGFLTRVAVKGKISFEAIEAAVLSINKFFPNAIKFFVINNKIRKVSKQVQKTWSSPQNFQPHYSQYVVALAGFPCPLDEAEVRGFLELAGVDVNGAALSWYATESEDFVLQITTSKPEQISQLREREGGQHDITTFLKWTPKLFQSLRYVATLGKKLELVENSSVVVPSVRSPLSDREISDILQDGQTEAPADATASPSDHKTSEEWSVAGSRRKSRKNNSPSSTASSAGANRVPNSVSHHSPSSPLPSSSSSYQVLAAVAEEEEEEAGKAVTEAAEPVIPVNNSKEEKAAPKPVKKKGTTKEFQTIKQDIFKEVQRVQPAAKRTGWYHQLEEKMKTYYDLKYTASQVYEEMEKLLAQGGEQIILEFSPGSDDGAKRQSKRRKSTVVRKVADTSVDEEQEDVDIMSEEEAAVVCDSLSEIEDSHMDVADTPAKQLGQLSLHQSFLNSTTTSQNKNNKQNGAEQL